MLIRIIKFKCWILFLTEKLFMLCVIFLCIWNETYIPKNGSSLLTCHICQMPIYLFIRLHKSPICGINPHHTIYLFSIFIVDDGIMLGSNHRLVSVWTFIKSICMILVIGWQFVCLVARVISYDERCCSSSSDYRRVSPPWDHIKHRIECNDAFSNPSRWMYYAISNG